MNYIIIVFHNTLTFFTEMIIQIKLKIKKGCRRRNLGFRAWGTGSPSQRAANGGISAKALFFVYTFQLWVLFVFDLIFGALGTCIHSQRSANGAIWPRTIIRPARDRPMACELKTRFDVFCKKLENDQRMANYIQKREQLTNVTLRNRKPYKEIKARTAKYYRAPMNHVVRRLNQLHIQPPTSTP